MRFSRQYVLNKYFSTSSIDYRYMLAIFYPILIDQAFLLSMNMVNTAMISSSGVAAVSAVNMIDSLNMFLIGVFVAVATGGTVVVAQYKGNGNEAMVSRAAANTVSSVFLLSLCTSLLVILFHQPAIQMLFGAASPDVMANAKVYLFGSGMSYVGIAIVGAVCAALRGIGKTRPTLVLSLYMNMVYVLLNVVFINWLDMGVQGMVIAVNIARYSAAVFAIFYLVKIDIHLRFQIRDAIRLHVSMLRRIMFIGLPFALEQMFFNGGKMVTQVFIVSLGTNAIATNAIAVSLAGVSQIPSSALSITLITLVGLCMGSRNVEDARKITKSFVWVSSAFFLIMGLLICLFFQPLVGMFHPPAEIVKDISTIIFITMMMQTLLWTISFLLPSTFRAAGDSKFTSVVAMLSMWLVRIVLGYILGIVLHYGIVGIWVAMNVEWGVRGSIFLWRFLGKKWYRHRLID